MGDQSCRHGLTTHCAMCLNDAASLRLRLAESERQRAELVKLMQLLRSALREVLWIATVWNDHNHDTETIRRKASNIARDLGVKRGDDSAEEFLNQIDAAIASQNKS